VPAERKRGLEAVAADAAAERADIGARLDEAVVLCRARLMPEFPNEQMARIVSKVFGLKEGNYTLLEEMVDVVVRQAKSQ